MGARGSKGTARRAFFGHGSPLSSTQLTGPQFPPVAEFWKERRATPSMASRWSLLLYCESTIVNVITPSVLSSPTMVPTLEMTGVAAESHPVGLAGETSGQIGCKRFQVWL